MNVKHFIMEFWCENLVLTLSSLCDGECQATAKPQLCNSVATGLDVNVAVDKVTSFTVSIEVVTDV